MYVPFYILRGDRIDLAGVLLFRAHLRLSEQLLLIEVNSKNSTRFAFTTLYLSALCTLTGIHLQQHQNLLRKPSWTSTVARQQIKESTDIFHILRVHGTH